jgi:hypothetical protein
MDAHQGNLPQRRVDAALGLQEPRAGAVRLPIYEKKTISLRGLPRRFGWTALFSCDRDKDFICPDNRG